METWDNVDYAGAANQVGGFLQEVWRGIGQAANQFMADMTSDTPKGAVMSQVLAQQVQGTIALPPSVSIGSDEKDLAPGADENGQLSLFTPEEQFNRHKHYGRTPTRPQKNSVPPGMLFDHDLLWRNIIMRATVKAEFLVL